MVGIVTTIPWLCALAAAWFIPRAADRSGKRRMIAVYTLIAGGLGIAGSVLVSGVIPAIIFLCFATAGIIAVQPVFWTFPASYLTGRSAAGGIAFVNSVGTLGGFVAPNIKTWVEHELSSQSAGMLFLAISAFLAALAMYFIKERKLLSH